MGKNIDYAEFTQTGHRDPVPATSGKVKMKKQKQQDTELEEGQILDSPLRLNAKEDSEFLETSLTVSEVQEEELDHMDDLDTCMESEALAEHDHDNDHDQEQEDNITSEEGWLKRQCALDENREQREKMKLKLERQQQLAEAKLKDEEERLELAQMEQEIKDINARRLVTKSSAHVQSRIWKKLVSGSKTIKHFKSPKIGQWASKGVNAVSCGKVKAVNHESRVNIWLNSSQELDYLKEREAIHEYRPDIHVSPENHRSSCLPCLHSRKGLREEHKPVKEKQWVETVTTKDGTRQKDTQRIQARDKTPSVNRSVSEDSRSAGEYMYDHVYEGDDESGVSPC